MRRAEKPRRKRERARGAGRVRKVEADSRGDRRESPVWRGTGGFLESRGEDRSRLGGGGSSMDEEKMVYTSEHGDVVYVYEVLIDYVVSKIFK